MTSKKLTLFLVLFSSLLTYTSHGQEILSEIPMSISETGAPADSSSMLDVQSTSKGVLVPRMTSNERNAILNPADGLVVYNTTIEGFSYYNGMVWVDLTGDLWERSGNNTFYDSGFVGIGLAPVAPLSIKGSTGFASSNDEAYSLLVDTEGRLSFHANNMTGAGTPTLTLDDSIFKRVGIGTNNPQDKVHVGEGGVRIDEVTSSPNSKTVYGNSMPIAYGFIANGAVTTDFGLSSATNPSTGNYDVVLDQGFVGTPVVTVTCFSNTPIGEIATYSIAGPNVIKVHITDEAGDPRNSNFSLVVFGITQ